MAECPKCGSEIGSAAYCGCGWKKKPTAKEQKFVVDETAKCCHDVCNLSAKVKIQTKTGWANVCMRHYYEHHQKQAADYCAALGLHTTEQRRAWFRDQVKRLSARFTRNIPTSREPGQDDEWRDEAA